MHYYYLNDTDIIQEGDEFNFYNPHQRYKEIWTFCISSIGKTILKGLGEAYRVRRKIKKTPKGNFI